VIHYHGGPITPETCAVKAWASRHAFISFAHPYQIEVAALCSQSFALDNGAFSLWKAGKPVNWLDYYGWVGKWVRHPGFDFAVIPDVIEGSEKENDALLREWPFHGHEGAAVWHTNESIERLVRLATDFPRVAIGSSGEYDAANVSKLNKRLMDVLPHICDETGRPICKLHGLRMLNPRIFSQWPFASADSTNVAQNIGIDKRWKGAYSPSTKEARAQVLVERIESNNSAGSIHGPGIF
jgi:hypothetical protein